LDLCGGLVGFECEGVGVVYMEVVSVASTVVSWWWGEWKTREAIMDS
jgi:hypothetical protein